MLISTLMDTQITRASRPPKHHHDARKRGQLIEKIVCGWVRRWGYTSDKALQYLYPSRPRLGYDLAKKGVLKRYSADPGYRLLDGPAVYGMTNYAYEIAEDYLPDHILDIEHSRSDPAWSTMQHLLDCQRIAISFGMLPNSSDWLSEPETRARAKKGAVLVADMRASELDDEGMRVGLHWIEYDRSPKKDIALDYWSQLLAMRVSKALDESIPQQQRMEPIARISIIVGTQHQVERYRRVFAREYAEPIRRDRTTRKLKTLHQAARDPIHSVLGDLVEISTLSECIGEPEIDASERLAWLGLA